MGVFGHVEVMIECNSEKIADKIADNLEEKVRAYIKGADYKSFHLEFDGMDSYDSTITIQISSGRVQNAEWQGTMVKDFILKEHKEDIHSINGEVTTPESYFYWNCED